MNIQVLTLGGSGIYHVLNHIDPRLFTTFGLPPTLSAVDSAARPESR